MHISCYNSSCIKLYKDKFTLNLWWGSRKVNTTEKFMYRCVSKKVVKVLKEFDNILTNKLSNELSPEIEVDHKIDLVPRAKLQSKSPYQLNQVALAKLKWQLAELFIKWYIRPSKLLFEVSEFFVSNKNGQMQKCIDNRALNQVMVNNNHPMSRLNDLLNRLTSETDLSQIKLKSSNYQVRVKEVDVYKTAMQTHYRSYIFLMMSFRLCNAPATFMSIMNSVFHDKMNECMTLYIDNILAYSKSKNNYIRNLTKSLVSCDNSNYWWMQRMSSFLKSQIS